MKQIAYVIRHPRQKYIIPTCNGCEGMDCNELIFSNRKCAENMLDGGYMNKHYRIEEVEIQLLTK